MITKRIIACLDVHGGRVVKGVQFVDLVDAGDPATQAARHAREGADEIVLLDITATHEGRATLLDTVRRTARELFVPFCVGGGIRTADDAAQVFEAGADKVSVNSAAHRRLSLRSMPAAIPMLTILSATHRCLCRAVENLWADAWLSGPGRPRHVAPARFC